VEVVATASEYVPISTTVSHPGHSYTDCLGSTSYFGQFSSYGNFGSVSGTAHTNTDCSTTFSPPTESTLTTYRRVNYTIARSKEALYLLSCTQTWKLTTREKLLVGVIGGLEGGSGGDTGASDKATARAKGMWTECPAFEIGARFSLTVRNTSDARLEDIAVGKPAQGKPIKLEYLSSAALPPSEAQAKTLSQSQSVTAYERATVHFTSSPNGGEIYVDGKFIGNTPSDLTIAAGEHIVKVVSGGKEWSRSIHITNGEISIHAELPLDK
jgi:hypothetical protein